MAYAENGNTGNLISLHLLARANKTRDTKGSTYPLTRIERRRRKRIKRPCMSSWKRPLSKRKLPRKDKLKREFSLAIIPKQNPCMNIAFMICSK